MKLNKALKIIIACGGFLFVCIFISFKAHAEDVPVDLDFPLTLQHASNLNNYFSDNAYAIENDTNTSSLFSDDDYVFIPVDLDYYGAWDDWDWYWVTIVAVPIDTFSNPQSEHLINGNITANLVNGKGAYIFNLWIDVNGNYLSHIEEFYPYDVSQREFFGAHNTTTFAQYTFTSSYPVSWYKDIYSTNNTLILDYSSSTVITGSATAPNFGAGAGNGSDFLGANADFGASVSQATKPTAPTITNYIWNTYTAPSVDTSTLETLIQSLIEIVKYNTTYIVGGITGLIENLLTNIQNMFAYIGALIEYSLRVLVTNIQNAIQNLYENFKSLVEPIFQLLDIIKEKVEYITEPFDKNEFFHQVDGNHLITACIHIKDYGDQMKTILTNAQERNTFHLNISYPKPDGTSFNTMISFDWLYPLRHLYMPYLWVFTIIYLFFSACRLLGNVIGGKS